jgi:glycosyltransferase involved in cell wall biosynthesis
MAQTNRILTVGRALVRAGIRFTILNVGGGLYNNTLSNGIIDGIHFSHLPGRTDRPKLFATRLLTYGLGSLAAANFIQKLRRSEKYLCIYSWFRGGNLAFFHRFLRLIKCPVVAEVNEWWPGNREVRLRDADIRLTQGSIAISQFIIDRLTALPSYQPSHNILKLPILIDINSWPAGTKSDLEQLTPAHPYVAWCGNLQEAKDEVAFMIKSVRLLNQGHKCDLVLIGGYDKATVQHICSVCNDNDFPQHQLHLEGFVSDERLFLLMRSASALLLPLWNTERSLCRFPTKLGQYLLSATPTIATGVGEIVAYLKDGESACLALPADAQDFARKIEWVLTDRNRAAAIGRAGYEVAEREFSIKKYQPMLASFFKAIARGANEDS